MSDQFTVSLDVPRHPKSSWFEVKSTEYGGFSWKFDARYDSRFLMTISCQPIENKETLMWRCDAKAEVVVFGKHSNELKLEAQSPILRFLCFNSHADSSERKVRFFRNGRKARRIEIKVTIIRSYLVDVSSPNEFISGPSDAARFEIDGRVVYLSKKMLTRCSPFFAAMFNNDFLEKSTDTYALREVNFRQVLHLMAIVHRKTACIDASSIGYLVTLADMYDIREVAELCTAFLSSAEKIEDRESLLELCSHFDEENTVIESKIIDLDDHEPDDLDDFKHNFEIGAFRCDLRGVFDDCGDDALMLDLFPIEDKRTMLWRFVAENQSESLNTETIFDHHQDTFGVNYYSCIKYRDYIPNFNIIVELVQNDVIDLASPGNEFIKDPEDAVCLQVDGEKLWFSKTLIALTCPPICDLFKEAKSIYVIDNVIKYDYRMFLHFMAILHSNKFVIDERTVEYLLEMADRFCCSYVADRCEAFLLDPKCGLSRNKLVDLADRHQLLELMMKLSA